MTSKRVAVLILVFGAGCIVGVFIHSPFSRTAVSTFLSEERELDESYAYISPLLACPEVEIDHLANDEVNKLEGELLNAITKSKSRKEISDVGLYFRQLKGGPWLGINHEVQFYPRSLLKVPLVMAFYKKAEEDSRLRDARIRYREGDTGVYQYFGKDVIEMGKEYSVHELEEATLVYSDNNAAYLLSYLITLPDLQEAYADLGVEKPEDSADYTTDVRTYASFFRILYNATYNTREDSEHILKHLAEADFKKGLVAGVPPFIKVAHKFGEQADGETGLKQLHDCGIVYHPDKPYLLCVMTTGTDFEKMAGVIATLSRITYDSIAR